MSRRYGMIFLMVVLSIDVVAQDIESGEPEKETSRTWTPAQRDVSIPMRDHCFLLADIYQPEKKGRYPTILVQTPYNKKRFGAVTRGAAAGRGSQTATDRFDRAHYNYVVVDWRGFFGSKKAMNGVQRQGFQRGRDGYDCVEWIAQQEWSDGKVGTWGGSALGKQQFDTAAERPPHLVCCVPLIAAMGQRYEFYYEGGILREGHVETLDALGYGVSKRVKAAPRSSQPIWRLAERRSYHPERIEVPCLMVTGWWDHYPDRVIATFDDIVSRGGVAARKHSRLIVGPWDHVSIDVEKQGDLTFPGAAGGSTVLTMKFFDQFLRGIPQSWEDVPRMQYWQCHSDSGAPASADWVGVERWGKVERENVTWQLLPGGGIARKRDARKPDTRKPDTSNPGPPAGAAKREAPLSRSYHYDPRKPSRTLGGANLPTMPHGPKQQNALRTRPDVLVYSTRVLAEPLVVNGNVELTFTYSLNRVDADFTARLCDRTPENSSILVSDAAARSRFRDGSGRTDLLAPGERGRITLRFPVTAYTFRKGHQLELMVSSGNWPRYARNCHDGSDHWNESSALDLDVTIHHDVPATLVVPQVSTGTTGEAAIPDPKEG